MSKKIEAIPHPQSVDDILLVEVLDVEFGIKASDINGEIILPEGAVMPNDEEILAAKQSLLSKYNNNIYAKKRHALYPSLKEQMDALYRDIINDNLNAESSEFVAMIKAVKDSNPKPE
jgi:hypothetical protein